MGCSRLYAPLVSLVHASLSVFIVGYCRRARHVLSRPSSLLVVELVLQFDPRSERPKERRDHVEAAFLDQVLTSALLLHLVLAPHGRQIGQLIPGDLGNFFSRPWLKVCVHWYAAEDVQHHALLAHGNGDLLHLILRQHQPCFFQVVACLLPHLSHGAVQVVLLLVDLAAGKAPLGALLPAFDQHGVCHVLVQHDGAANGHAGLVGEELVVGLLVQGGRVGGEERTVLEHELRELAQVHRGQAVRVQRADEVFVEPLCFFDLEANALDGEQLLLRQVDDEADAQIVQPLNERHLGVCVCSGHVGRCRAACSGHTCL
ncbi:hypothetical protein B5807_10585 [Epicoccum nigrum]|uniref:Uncharacterized protein n=1 Tax=Epicoccum nigrum TaxID=105696 RepID=A0A1Y2LL83_EPING|nr:hypothetical protein B5807_10585 [Epicoccum nigrum]